MVWSNTSSSSVKELLGKMVIAFISVLGIYIQVSITPVFISPGQPLALQASIGPGGPSAHCSQLRPSHEAAAPPMKEEALVAKPWVGSPHHLSSSRVQVHARQPECLVRLKPTFLVGQTRGARPGPDEDFTPTAAAPPDPAARAAEADCGSRASRGAWVLLHLEMDRA